MMSLIQAWVSTDHRPLVGGQRKSAMGQSQCLTSECQRIWAEWVVELQRKMSQSRGSYSAPTSLARTQMAASLDGSTSLPQTSR
jgi:hypothetical protein